MAEDSNKKFFSGPAYENDNKTGLSHFVLSTAINSTENKPSTIQLHGLLSELPEMSFTVNYEEGPGSTFQDLFSDFMANDLMQIFNAIGAKGSSFKNIVKAGTWTKQVYNGYSPSTIPLKFRIYTRDPLGQSSPGAWITNLKKYAAIDSSNEFNIQNAVGNIKSAIQNAYNTGSGMANIVNAAYAQKQENKQTEETTEEKNAKAERKACRLFAKINRFLKESTAIINELPKTNEFTVNMYLVPVVEDKDDVNTSTVKFHAELIDKTVRAANYTTDDKEIGTWSRNPTVNSMLDSNKFKEAINAFKNGVGDEQKAVVQKELEACLHRVEQAFSDEETTGTTNEEASVQNALTFIKFAANSVGKLATEKYGDYRVYEKLNRENCLGAKLWHLHIYDNVIFKATKPLVVYISEWSYKPSEEVDNEEPVYYDFELTCALDQVYSRKVWFDKIADIKEAPSSNLVTFDGYSQYKDSIKKLDGISQAAEQAAAAMYGRRR